MAREIRVLVADDHSVVREGLRALIESEPGMEVVGEARDGVEAVSKAASMRPDVILMDMQMPRKNGLEAILELAEAGSPSRILVLTSFAEDDMVFPAIKAGATGYLLKDASPSELLMAIRRVHRGESSLHPSIASRLIQELRSPPKESPTPDQLTERELEVLRLVAQGLTNQDIGKRLFIGERTVRNHVSAILAKLHLANRTQAALHALREGWASLEPE